MALNPTRLPALLDEPARIARHAGETILEVYRSDFQARSNDDASPATEADERAEAVIVPALQQFAPGVPVVAEKDVAAGHVPVVGVELWLIDPLDGTKEFIGRNGEFTVNIALVQHGLLGNLMLGPVPGVILGSMIGSRLPAAALQHGIALVLGAVAVKLLWAA